MSEHAVEIARAFHETYERLAPTVGYETRADTRQPWAELPIENRRLMIAVVQELLDRGVIRPSFRSVIPS